MGNSVRKFPSTQQDCETKYSDLSFLENMTATGGIFCQPVFDQFLCWPPTSANTTAYLECPMFARGVDISKKAHRVCGTNGKWEGKKLLPGDSHSNETIGFTNYTPCFSDGILKLLEILSRRNDTDLIQSIARNTRILEVVGLAASMLSLIISLLIFCHFRNLWNNRTKIHKNLFIAMGIQVVIRFTVYIDQYVSRTEGQYGIDNTPYVCESFYALLEYAKTAMFLWMFVEGLYLHNILAVSVFQDRITQSFYCLLGWGAPVILTGIWALATWTQFHNIVCWWGYNFSPIFWILEGPRGIVIALNLIFLLNIIRVLVTKLRESNSSEAQQVRKAVKAAIVLLPLLGITNALQFISPLEQDPEFFAVWSYLTAFLTTFQGFFCALIYCFLNGEVQLSLIRCWRSRVAGGSVGKSGQRRKSTIPMNNLITSKSQPKEAVVQDDKDKPNRNMTVDNESSVVNAVHSEHSYHDPFFREWNEVEIEHVEIPEYLQKTRRAGVSSSSQ